jgi:hypothetical protein
MKNIKKTSLLLLVIFATVSIANAQYASRKLSKKQIAYTDSLKAVEYDNLLPIWGQQAYKKGFHIPYPTGVMANYMWMKQGIVIDNFQLGIQSDGLDFPLTPVDFIEFGSNTNTSYVVNFRPDVWVLPFLNVYGLFGYGASTTEINLVKPVPLYTSVTQNMSTMGFGVMGAFGLGPVWMSLDGNWAWTKPELLEDPVLSKVFGVRLGKTFTFNKHPERNIAVWVGGMRLRMDSYTVGSIKLADAIPPEAWGRIDEIVDSYYGWYDGLGAAMKKKVDDSSIPEIVDKLEASDGSAIISYAMDKAPEQEWNVLFGAQFQLNKRWMLRSEAGLIGDRKSFLASINYRFLL